MSKTAKSLLQVSVVFYIYKQSISTIYMDYGIIYEVTVKYITVVINPSSKTLRFSGGKEQRQ